MAVNKVIFGSTTLIDLTSDTVEASKILKGFVGHDKAGESITGTCTYDADTSAATATASEILKSKTAVVRGATVTGTMPNNGAVSGEIDSVDDTYSVPLGFHDGSGTVGISATEKAKIVPGNIKSGVEVLGVTGTYSGEAITAQSKTVTPKITAQTVQPDTGYDYLSAVTVNAITYTETDNSAGGKTVTIGAV